MNDQEHPEVDDRVKLLRTELTFWEDFLGAAVERGAVSDTAKVFAKESMRASKINVRELRETILLLENVTDKKHGLDSLLRLSTHSIKFGYIVGREVVSADAYDDVRRRMTEKARGAKTTNRQSQIVDFAVKHQLEAYR